MNSDDKDFILMLASRVKRGQYVKAAERVRAAPECRMYLWGPGMTQLAADETIGGDILVFGSDHS